MGGAEAQQDPSGAHRLHPAASTGDFFPCGVAPQLCLKPEQLCDSIPACPQGEEELACGRNLVSLVEAKAGGGERRYSSLPCVFSPLPLRWEAPREQGVLAQNTHAQMASALVSAW